MPLKHVTKVLKKFALRINKLKTFVYSKISNYLTTYLEVEEEARILNLSKVIKKITLEVKFELA